MVKLKRCESRLRLKNHFLKRFNNGFDRILETNAEINPSYVLSTNFMSVSFNYHNFSYAY